jgi:RNA polymerase sigma-70 factor (ECF subfamily)
MPDSEAVFCEMQKAAFLFLKKTENFFKETDPAIRLTIMARENTQRTEPHMPESESAALVASARQGNREAFRRLLEGHYDTIYRIAYRFTGHRQDAEDVAQEVCASLAGKLASYRGESRFTTWLYRVVVNACRDRHRQRSSHRELQQRYMEMEKDAQADATDSARKVAWLYRQLTALEEPLRETALLVVAEALSHAEAAAILECAESTVSWRMHEIRKRLKAGWDGSYG